MRALQIIISLPEGLSKKEIDARTGDKAELVLFWAGRMESLGILVFRREISLDIIDDFFSGQVVFSWHKLKQYIADLRVETGRDTMSEWF